MRGWRVLLVAVVVVLGVAGCGAGTGGGPGQRWRSVWSESDEGGGGAPPRDFHVVDGGTAYVDLAQLAPYGLLDQGYLRWDGHRWTSGGGRSDELDRLRGWRRVDDRHDDDHPTFELWLGNRWRRSDAVPTGMAVEQVRRLAGDDVWVLGAPAQLGATLPVSGVAHWDGSRLAEVDAPDGVADVARAGGRTWVLTGRGGLDSWDGARFSPVTLPRGAGKLVGLAASGRNVYAYGDSLLESTGGAWRAVSVPAGAGPFSAAAGDGSGGVWLGDQGRYRRYTSGGWSSAPIPDRAQLNFGRCTAADCGHPAITDLAAVPGTGRVWAVVTSGGGEEGGVDAAQIQLGEAA